MKHDQNSVCQQPNLKISANVCVKWSYIHLKPELVKVYIFKSLGGVVNSVAMPTWERFTIEKKNGFERAPKKEKV